VRARFNSRPSPGGQSICSQDPHETHYTVKDIAKEWKVDEETIRKVFIDEPGVLDLGKRDRRDGKRNYCVLRIPESVLTRVYARRTQKKF
jgi:hypothetical protein